MKAVYVFMAVCLVVGLALTGYKKDKTHIRFS